MNSAKVADNALTGADINEATLTKVPDADAVDGLDSSLLVGPRAYGRVNPASCAATAPFACSADDAKGVSGVRRPVTGAYCISVPGVDRSSIPLVASVDWVTTAGTAEGDASAMPHEHPGFCELNEMGLVTEAHFSVEVATPNGGVTSVAGHAEKSNSVGFTFIVP